MTLCCKDIGIGKSEFVTKTPFLYLILKAIVSKKCLKSVFVIVFLKLLKKLIYIYFKVSLKGMCTNRASYTSI